MVQEAYWRNTGVRAILESFVNIRYLRNIRTVAGR